MKPDIRVTDHAVLRYLERAHGLDVEAIRNHLAGRAMTGVQLGASAVIIEGVKLILKDGVLITVYKLGWPSWSSEPQGGHDASI